MYAVVSAVYLRSELRDFRHSVVLSAEGMRVRFSAAGGTERLKQYPALRSSSHYYSVTAVEHGYILHVKPLGRLAKFHMNINVISKRTPMSGPRVP